MSTASLDQLSVIRSRAAGNGVNDLTLRGVRSIPRRRETRVDEYLLVFLSSQVATAGHVTRIDITR